jgi:L-2,4-diaminobutyric acid acetyltransferase
VIAEHDGQVVGWVSAYRLPAAPESMFVWQVAVDSTMRGTGLAGRMLDALSARRSAHGITTFTATITESNARSWALFDSFARRHGMRVTRSSLFERGAHFSGAHETEHLVSVGPLTGDFRSSSQEKT